MQIVATDFEKDRALSVNGKNYCQKCRKEAPVPATAGGAKAPSSDRLSVKARPSQTGSRVMDAITPPPSSRKVVTPPPRRSGATPPVRRAGGTTRIRVPDAPAAPNRKPLIIGGGIGAVVLIGVIAAFAMTGDPPANNGKNSSASNNNGQTNRDPIENPPPEETPDQKLWKNLQEVDQTNPDDPEKVLAYFQQRREKLTDKALLALADKRIAELEKIIEEGKHDDDLASILREADKVSVEDDLPRLVELLAAADEQVAGSEERRRKIEAVRADVKSQLSTMVPQRTRDAAEMVEDYIEEKTYQYGITLVEELLEFLKAAANFVDTATEQAAWSKKLEELQALDKAESEKPEPTPMEPEAGAWIALFEGDLAGWEVLPMEATGEWTLDGKAMAGKRGKDGKGQYGAGYGRQDVLLADFDMEIDMEVVKGIAYLVPRANVGGGNITGGLVTINPEGGREVVKIRAVGRDMTIESPSTGKIQGRLIDQAGDAGGFLLLLGEATEVRIHSIRTRDLK